MSKKANLKLFYNKPFKLCALASRAISQGEMLLQTDRKNFCFFDVAHIGNSTFDKIDCQAITLHRKYFAGMNTPLRFIIWTSLIDELT